MQVKIQLSVVVLRLDGVLVPIPLMLLVVFSWELMLVNNKMVGIILP